MFKLGFLDINLHKYVLRKEIKSICFSGINSFQTAVQCNFFLIGMPPSCVNHKVTCSCHVSEICAVYGKDRTNCVCMLMIYACRKCSKSHMSGFIVCFLTIYACRKCTKSHIADFLGGILCTCAYRCIFLCSVLQ